MCPRGVSQTQICPVSHCINEETKAELVDSLPKVTTDKYQELAGLDLLTQGCVVFFLSLCIITAY